MKKTKKRIFYLDLIRVIAVFLVITVHFFLRVDYYNIKLKGVSIYIGEIIRVIAMCCVPLFLILTGFLKNKCKLNKKYYLGIVRILVAYLIISIIEMLFKKFYLHESASIFLIIKSIFDYTGANYSWYVELYIGLFLLIPFVNALYKKLTKQERKYFIITLLFLTVFPSLFNTFDITFSQGIKEFFLSYNGQDKILPTFWDCLYPLTYYYIGCYLYDNRKKVYSVKKLLLIYVICMVLFGTINYIYNYNSTFRYIEITHNWNSIECVVNSVLVFLICQNCSFKKVPDLIKKLVSKLSEISFSTYLLSYVFDMIFYQMLNDNFIHFKDKLLFLPLIVIAVFICSNIAAFLIEILVKKITFIINNRLTKQNA